MKTQMFDDSSQMDFESQDVKLYKAVKSLSYRRCKVDIKFENIGYSVQANGKKKTVLSGISGRFKHGRLNCIMGPSGAGKSSLLNVMAGFNTITDGTIYINNVPFEAKKCLPTMSKISSYIMQEDHLLGELTTRETVIYAARFKLQQHLVSGQLGYEQMADHVLSLTGLTESANRPVSQLSGGQRKRLAVSVELVNYPPVIFLDECTTGLDSTSTLRLIKTLKMLAKSGCNIITTIHQPNSLAYRMFDWLYVMAPGGYIAYNGHPMAVARVLKTIGVTCLPSENPADVLFENSCIIPRLAESWYSLGTTQKTFSSVVETEVAEKKRWTTCIEGDYYMWCFDAPPVKQLEKSKLPRYKGEELTNFCGAQLISKAAQWRIYMDRSIKQTGRDKIFFIGRYIALFAVALLIGNLFLSAGTDASKTVANTALLYFFTNAMLAGPALFAVLAAESHFKNLLRESINGWYSVATCYFVRSLIEIFSNVTSVSMFTIIVWLMSGQPVPQLSLPIGILVLCVQAITTYHLMFILCLYGDTQANFQLPFLLSTVQCLFGGYMIPVNTLPNWISWVPKLNYASFSYFALMKAVYSPTEGISVEIPCVTPSLFCYRYTNGTAILADQHIEAGLPWDDLWKIALYGALYIALGWPLLARRIRSAKKEVARI